MLPVEPAWRLAERDEEHRWLVAGLWSEQAVGIVGGEPKCCKSFLALDLAVSVAAGTPCLRRFAVPEPGRVLLYAAEDALHIVDAASTASAPPPASTLADLDIQVITAPTLRLDLEADRSSLAETVGALAAPPARPRSLRATAPHRRERLRRGRARCSPICASSSAATASPCSSSTTPGRAAPASAPARPCAARPSSTPGATPTSICVATARAHPHRRASRRASSRPLVVELVPTARPSPWKPSTGQTVAVNTPSLDERVIAALVEAPSALPFAELRARCRVRAATLHERVGLLAAAGRIVKTVDGYQLADP